MNLPMAFLFAVLIIAVLFCYAQMRYHEGVIDGLDMAEKIVNDTLQKGKL